MGGGAAGGPVVGAGVLLPERSGLSSASIAMGALESLPLPLRLERPSRGRLLPEESEARPLGLSMGAESGLEPAIVAPG